MVRPMTIARLSHSAYTFVVYQMHLTDYLITLVSVCVIVERLRPQFFTDFHQILHAAQKLGCFEGYCF